MTLLPSSELIVEPAESQFYCLISIGILFFAVFILLFGTMPILAKCFFMFFLIVFIVPVFMHKKPYPSLQFILFSKHCEIVAHSERQTFEEAVLLIDNTYFQLLKFKNKRRNKILVLFYDQIPYEQWIQLQLYFRTR